MIELIATVCLLGMPDACTQIKIKGDANAQLPYQCYMVANEALVDFYRKHQNGPQWILKITNVRM